MFFIDFVCFLVDSISMKSNKILTIHLLLCCFDHKTHNFCDHTYPASHDFVCCYLDLKVFPSSMVKAKIVIYLVY